MPSDSRSVLVTSGSPPARYASSSVADSARRRAAVPTSARTASRSGDRPAGWRAARPRPPSGRPSGAEPTISVTWDDDIIDPPGVSCWRTVRRHMLVRGVQLVDQVLVLPDADSAERDHRQAEHARRDPPRAHPAPARRTTAVRGAAEPRPGDRRRDDRPGDGDGLWLGNRLGFRHRFGLGDRLRFGLGLGLGLRLGFGLGSGSGSGRVPARVRARARVGLRLADRAAAQAPPPEAAA